MATLKLPTANPLSARNAWAIQRAVIFALMLRELRTRVGGRWLGLMWLVFEPAAHVLLLLTLFTFVRNIASPYIEFPVFLVLGLLPFFLFRNLALRIADAVSSNRGLFNYRQVTPADTMIARSLVEVSLYLAVFSLTMSLLGWLGFQWWPRAPLELLMVGGILIALGAGLGLTFSVLTNGRPRVRSVIGLLFFPLYLLSGVIFPVRAVAPALREALLWNPVLHLVELSRFYFIPGYHRLQEVSLSYPATWALGAVTLGLALYRVAHRHLRAGD